MTMNRQGPGLAQDQLERLTTLERVCEGLTQDHIDGGWTASGVRAHCKAVETERNRLCAQLAKQSEALNHIACLAEMQLELIKARAPGRFLDKSPMVRALGRYREIALTTIETDEAFEGALK